MVPATPPQAIGRLLFPAGQGWYHAWPPQGQVLRRMVEVEQEWYYRALEGGETEHSTRTTR